MTTWQEVVDGNFIGGDLEFRNGEGFLHRGPIRQIILDTDGDMITFDLEWMAIMDTEVWEWAKSPESVIPGLNFPASWAAPCDIGEGRIHFVVSIPMIMTVEATLFPLGGSKLEQDKVADRIYDPLAV